MIAETRERTERWEDECIQALESSLRQEYNSKSIKMAKINDIATQRLTLKAIDWGYVHGIEIDQQKAVHLANVAIQRYKNNWYNKEQGVDDRGHRFGKSSYL